VHKAKLAHGGYLRPFPGQGLLVSLAVSLLLISGCSESVEADLASRAPRGSTIKRDGQDQNAIQADHSGCDSKSGSRPGANLDQLHLKDAKTNSQDEAESCPDGSRQAGSGTGTSTGKKTAEVSRPAGMTPPDTTPSSPSPAPSPAPANVTPGLNLGAQLYTQECQRCHGAARTYPLNKSSQAIRAAINTRAQMRNIVLSDDQLRMISEHLMAP
jgi:hypothetical protein